MKKFHLQKVDRNYLSTGRWKFFINFARRIKSSPQGHLGPIKRTVLFDNCKPVLFSSLQVWMSCVLPMWLKRERRLLSDGSLFIIISLSQVNISYLAMTREGGESWVARQRELMRGYGFFCTCQACSLEGPQLDTEEELRENLKQLQARGAQNWVKEEVSEYLEGMSQLQGNPSHILGVLDICFHASKDQVVLFHRNN